MMLETAQNNSSGSENRKAVFIFTAPRSGSTLLRVILGGHSQLFAPPELELLSFETLRERKKTFCGQYSFWLEGTIRAVMQARGCNAHEAIQIMEDCERQNLTTQEFYHLLQQWIGDKIVVDKTPCYALNPAALERAEKYFDNARYIHLLRHPCAMVRSWERAKTDQVIYWKPQEFSGRELAEMVWLICNQNILEFLKQVPSHRKCTVKFEELVKHPKIVAQALCQYLDLEFEEQMLRPYQEKKSRMTDGIHSLSKMLGDVNFHDHNDIDANVADQWQKDYSAEVLSDITWELAQSFGYQRLQHKVEK